MGAVREWPPRLVAALDCHCSQMVVVPLMYLQPEGSTSVLMLPVDTRHRGQCGKACYGSKGAADRSVKAMKRTGRDQRYRGYLHSYICTICRAWHVGHTEYED